MCGIAGYSLDKTDAKTAAALAILALEMEDRGSHSWGTMSNTRFNKGVGPITSGFGLPSVLPNSFALHTRFATTGKIETRNSHPFKIIGSMGEVIGMHNGIVYNHEDLNRKYGRECSVDSEHIFHHIADGVALDDIEAYGAIVYRLNGVWHIGRFNYGDMAVAGTKHGYFFASTDKALASALALAGIKHDAIVVLPNDKIYTFGPRNFDFVYDINMKFGVGKWDDSYALESCEECGFIIRGRVYHNVEGKPVCADCVENEYSYIADDVYERMQAREASAQGYVTCDNCKSILAGDEMVYLVYTSGEEICSNCFHTMYYTTKMGGNADDNLSNDERLEELGRLLEEGNC